MFKKLLTITAAALLAFSAHAARFEAGEDYKILKSPTTTQPTVTEYFSFYCPHCYNSQGLMHELKNNLPENVKFNGNPVSFMGGEMGKTLSKAFAVANLLKVEDKVAPVIFAKIHAQKKPPVNIAEVRQIFIDEGVDGSKFDAAYNSFAVNGATARFDKSFSATGLTGVPAVVVNGKYQVTPKTIKTPEEYVELVTYLTTLK